MNPDPKKKRIKLNDRDYRKLRVALHKRAYGKCEVCREWAPLHSGHVHHKKSRGAGGDDTEDN